MSIVVLDNALLPDCGAATGSGASAGYGTAAAADAREEASGARRGIIRCFREVVELEYLKEINGKCEELHRAEGEQLPRPQAEQRPQIAALVQAANLQEAQAAEGVVIESGFGEKPDECDNEGINSVEGREYSHGDV
ncbi:hypothetical protein ACLOJK_021146 [Asimina triloba]